GGDPAAGAGADQPRRGNHARRGRWAALGHPPPGDQRPRRADGGAAPAVRPTGRGALNDEAHGVLPWACRSMPRSYFFFGSPFGGDAGVSPGRPVPTPTRVGKTATPAPGRRCPVGDSPSRPRSCPAK